MSSPTSYINHLLATIAWHIIACAVEAFFLKIVWNIAVVPVFEFNEIHFGNMFLIVLATKYFVRSLFKFSDLYGAIMDMRDVQHYEAMSKSKSLPKKEEANKDA